MVLYEQDGLAEEKIEGHIVGGHLANILPKIKREAAVPCDRRLYVIRNRENWRLSARMRVRIDRGGEVVRLKHGQCGFGKGALRGIP